MAKINMDAYRKLLRNQKTIESYMKERFHISMLQKYLAQQHLPDTFDPENDDEISRMLENLIAIENQILKTADELRRIRSGTSDAKPKARKSTKTRRKHRDGLTAAQALIKLLSKANGKRFTSRDIATGIGRELGTVATNLSKLKNDSRQYPKIEHEGGFYWIES